MTASDPRVGEIRARLEAAVKEPWHLAGGDEWISPIGICIAPDDGGVSVSEGEFIANAPADIAYLAEELEKALGLLQERDEALARVEALHKPETRWMPYEGAGVSFDTREEALQAADAADVGICATVPATFEVCAHCKRIEDSPCEGQCTLQAGYLEALWPCPTAAAVAAANGDN